MRKALFLISSLFATVALADSNESSAVADATVQAPANEYSAYQKFDRQFSLGYGITGGSLKTPGNSGVYNLSMIDFNLERLFDMGLWMNVDAYINTSYHQSPNVDPAVQLFGNLTGSDPQFGGLNAKVGYAFNLDNEHLLLTPYGELGRNTNYSSYTLQATTTTNLVNNYYWTYGLGARLEYRLNDLFDFYLDQNFLYNDSQSEMTQNLPQANFFSYRTTLGGKYNVWRNMQIGAQAFWNKYSYTSTLVSANPSSAATTANVLVPDNSVGGIVSLGLTY